MAIVPQLRGPLRAVCTELSPPVNLVPLVPNLEQVKLAHACANLLEINHTEGETLEDLGRLARSILILQNLSVVFLDEAGLWLRASTHDIALLAQEILDQSPKCAIPQ